MVQDSNVSTVAGHISVVDLKGCGMSLLSQMNPSVLKKLGNLMDVYPINVKSMHLVNVSKTVETTLKVSHSLFNVNISAYASFDEFNKAYPEIQKHLPKEYGGPNSNLSDIIAKWKENLLAHRQWYLDDTQYLVTNVNPNENANGEMFGVGGSFRTLSID